MSTPQVRWIGFVLVLLTVGVYLPISQHEFVNYDDPSYVTANHTVQSGLTRDGIAWAFGQVHGDRTYWHPLAWISHMLDCQLFGVNPGAHHLVNLLFHTLNVLLLFLLLKRMTGMIWCGAAVAILFGVHPLQVDTVAWVTERKTVLATLFWLLAMLAYVRYAEQPGLRRYLPIALWFTLGLLSKPILVTLPFALVLLDFWPLRRFRFARSLKPQENNPLWFDPPRCPAEPASRLVVEKLPLLALSVASSVITIVGHHGLGITHEALGLSLKLRLDNAIVSYARYLGKVFWPVNLAVLYPHPGVWPAEAIVLSGALLLGISAIVVGFWRRAPYLAVGWFWFLGVLIPTIGLVQAGVQAMADRFMYVPLIGVFIAIVFGLADIGGRLRRRETGHALVAGAAVASCLVCTSLQLRHWRNSQALFEHAIRVTSGNFVMHYDLGLTLGMLGKTNEAVPHFREALRINPNLADVQNVLGLVAERQHQYDEAIQCYRNAARLKPHWSAPRKSLASLLAGAGRIDDAVAEYGMLIQDDPGDAELHAQLGNLLSQQKRFAEALAQWRIALNLKPDWPELLNNLAWLLATHPAANVRNGAEAVQMAERACQLTRYERAVFVGTLGAAYAEAGRFPEAVVAAKKAHDLAQAAGESERAETNLKLMELYRAGKCYRDEGGK